MGVRRAVCALGAGVALALVLPPATAHADAIRPEGACIGSGHWEKAGLTYISSEVDQQDTLKIPQADTVDWAGNQKGYALGAEGPARPISGEVQVDLPIGTATIDDWGNDSVRYANQGTHSYDLPSVLVGIKLKLHGEHRENGAVTCSGAVYVQVDGAATKNPLTAAAAIGLILSGGALVWAGRPVFKKVQPAFEDINPG